MALYYIVIKAPGYLNSYAVSLEEVGSDWSQDLLPQKNLFGPFKDSLVSLGFNSVQETLNNPKSVL